MRASVDSILRDKKYKIVEDKPTGGWPHSYQITAQNLEDLSYWCTTYRVNTDDAETDDVKDWKKARKVIVETYEAE